MPKVMPGMDKKQPSPKPRKAKKGSALYKSLMRH